MPDSGYFEKIGKQGKKILSYLMKEQRKLKIPVEECPDEKMKSLITKNIANYLEATPQTIPPTLGILESSGILSAGKAQ